MTWQEVDPVVVGLDRRRATRLIEVATEVVEEPVQERLPWGHVDGPDRGLPNVVAGGA